MAKQRYINTKFWSDNWVSDLDPLERYLFLYFLTNEHTNIAGIYELPLRTMAFETGIEKDMLLKMLPRFENKVYYIDGWIYIKNFAKHQAVNESVSKGIKSSLSEIPREILEKVDKLKTACDSLSDPATYLNVDSNVDLNLNVDMEAVAVPTPAQEAKKFFDGEFEPILQEFIEKTHGPPDQLRNEFSKFILYWTEKNKSGTRQRWETEKTFEVRRRIATWLGNIKQFNKVETNRGRGLA